MPFDSTASRSEHWLTDAVSDTARSTQWGLASRKRVEDHFSWEAVADRTLEVYRAASA